MSTTTTTTRPELPSIDRLTRVVPSPEGTSEALVDHRLHRGEIAARTPAGRRFVEIAEALIPPLEAMAGEHDRTRSYPHESLDLVRTSGLPWAAAPEEVGGLGLSSVHDLVTGAGRLARGNPSLAVGVNMHLIVMDALAHRGRCTTTDLGGAERARLGLERLARGRVLVAAAISEHGQDLLRPRTSAVRSADGWVIEGRKAFCTMSPAADVLNVAVTYESDDRSERIGFAQVPAGTPGVRVENDWDALGMRASGSHSVTFSDVRISADQLQDAFPAGRATSDWLDRYTTSGLLHASAALGIAESAHATVTAVDSGRREPRAADPRALMAVADNAIALGAMRATLSAAADRIDEHRARVEHASQPSSDDRVELMATVQRAKAFVDANAVDVVDRALELSGGAGYLESSPLARAWRDVRASAFMHPYGANRGYAIVGAVELGVEPSWG